MWNWNDGTTYGSTKNDYLAHHGILGQKWGLRRFQNPDGSYTEAGKERYGRLSSTNANVYTEASTFEQRKSIEKRKVLNKAAKTTSLAAALPFVLAASGAGIGTAALGPAGTLTGLFTGWASGVIGAGIVSIANANSANRKITEIDEKYLAAKEAEQAARNLQDKEEAYWTSSSYTQWYNKVNSFTKEDIPKDSKLSTAGLDLKKVYKQQNKDSVDYFSKIGGNNLWNRMAEAKDDYERASAIGLSVIEKSLRDNTNYKKQCGLEEAYAVENVIQDVNEIGYDFPGSISDHEMKMVNEYARRYGSRGQN